MYIVEIMKKNKKLTGVIIIAVLVFAGTGVALKVHNTNVQAEAAAKAEDEYNNLLKDVKELIKTAYDTRKSEDIEKATKAIGKLKKDDKKTYQKEITKLQGFISQVAEAIKLIAAAEKSKAQQDVDAAQKAIDGETDKYLENDKKAQQERLDKVSAAIKAKKAKEEQEKKAQEKKAAEEKKKASEQAAKAAADNAEQAQQAVVAQTEPNVDIPADESATYNNGTVDNNQNYYEAPAVQDQGSYTPQAPAQPAPTPAAPSQPTTPQTPSTPAGGSGNGISTQDELNQHEKDASTGGASNWDDVFGKH